MSEYKDGRGDYYLAEGWRESRPDEPRTEAGRELLAARGEVGRMREYILAIEAEARSAGAASLDVKRLAEAHNAVLGIGSELRAGQWDRIAARYARLTEGANR